MCIRDRVIVIEDLDGLQEKALYGLREFISNQVLRSSVTVKDKKGNNKSRKREVKGRFSSLSATTRGESYEDNMNRSFLVATDESVAQTSKIIDYQNRRAAGLVSEAREQKNIARIRELVRMLKPMEVINPYAPFIKLPENVHQIRRLNEMYQAVIKQVTLVNQYQRRQLAAAGGKPGGSKPGAPAGSKLGAPAGSKESTEGKLITEIEDIEIATEILTRSMVLKVDELDGALRGFFEQLKKSFNKKPFTRFEAMAVSGYRRSQLQYYLNELLRLEYLKQKGYANRGYSYSLNHSDNISSIRDQIQEHFKAQLRSLKKGKSVANGSQSVANR